MIGTAGYHPSSAVECLLSRFGRTRSGSPPLARLDDGGGDAVDGALHSGVVELERNPIADGQIRGPNKQQVDSLKGQTGLALFTACVGEASVSYQGTVTERRGDGRVVWVDVRADS